MYNNSYEVSPIEYLKIEQRDACESTRRLTNEMLTMRQRRLKNGIVINFSFNYLCGCPHFEYFSHELSSTGYLSDFFIYEAPLTEEEILEAFDVRANRQYEKSQIEKKRSEREDLRARHTQERLEKEIRTNQTVQLTLDF
jgi:hypothetical protein